MLTEHVLGKGRIIGSKTSLPLGVREMMATRGKMEAIKKKATVRTRWFKKQEP